MRSAVRVGLAAAAGTQRSPGQDEVYSTSGKSKTTCGDPKEKETPKGTGGNSERLVG